MEALAPDTRVVGSEIHLLVSGWPPKPFDEAAGAL
jgi:hypothetical protein